MEVEVDAILKSDLNSVVGPLNINDILGDPEKPLVHIPLALIFHDYFKRNAHNNFRKGELILFNWDIDRRHYIIEHPEESKGKTKGRPSGHPKIFCLLDA